MANKKKNEKGSELLEYSVSNKEQFNKLDIDFFEKVQTGKVISSKFLESQKRQVIMSSKHLLQQNPKLPLKQIIITILKDQPDWLPAENLKKVVAYITKTWQAQTLETVSLEAD